MKLLKQDVFGNVLLIKRYLIRIKIRWNCYRAQIKIGEYTNIEQPDTKVITPSTTISITPVHPPSEPTASLAKKTETENHDFYIA